MNMYKRSTVEKGNYRMVRRKRYTVILLIFAVAVLLLAATMILYARYRELTDFSNRLSRLVAAETEGRYRLQIEKEEKDFYNLRVIFRNISLERVAGNDAGSIQSVHIPKIAVTLGSLQSWLVTRQIDIETFAVDEPVVKVRTAGKRNHNVTITRNLLDIYPAVEAILNNFLIHSFTIQRGNLKINNAEKEVVNLRLIDFLVQEWNMRDLDPDSHIALRIGQQNLPIDKSTLSFSSIEFQYPQHYLLFKDLSFASRDTVSQSQINVQGATILIEGLDYDELYHHERYKLRKIEVQHPHISGTLHVGKKGGKGHSRYLLANLLRQMFGEASLDSAVVKKASINLAIAHGKDSLVTHLPQVDISIAQFVIPKENTDLQIEGIHINLNNTALQLNDDVVLHCDGLGFVRNRHLDIENARLTRASGGAPFIQCKRIHLQSFGLLDLIFDKHLSADSLLVEDADVSMSRPDLLLFPRLSGDSVQHEKKMLLNLGVLALRNVNFHYHDGGQSVTARGVHANFHSIHGPTLRALVPQLSRAEARSVAFEDRGRSLRGHADRAVYTSGSLRLGRLDLSAGNISVQGSGIKVKPVFTGPSEIDAWHWEELAANQFSISGTLPEPRGGTSGEAPRVVSVNILSVANLVTDLHTGKTRISFTGKAIRGHHLSTGLSAEQNLQGTLHAVQVITPKTQVRVDSFSFALNRRSIAYQVHIKQGDTDIAFPYAVLGRITQTSEQATQIAYIRARRFEAARNSRTLVSTDSILLRSVQFSEKEKPTLKELVVYGPVIPLGPRATQDIKAKPEWPEGIDRVSLYNGKVLLRNQKAFRFNHVECNINDHRLRLDSGWYDTSNAMVRIGGLNITDDALSIGLVQVSPTASFIQGMQTENDIIEGTFRDLEFTRFVPDSLYNNGHIEANDLRIGHVLLSVRRDKRLPDPPPAEKVFFLHEMLPRMLHVNQLFIADGTVRYTETSEKTGKPGEIVLQKLQATATGLNGRDLSHGVDLNAQALLYGQAPFSVHYQVLNANQFQFTLDVKPFDLTILNRVVVPLQSIEIRSGYLQSFSVDVTAGRELAEGFATMSYRDLHLEIQKAGDPAKKNLGKNLSSTFLTFVADGLILRNNKTRAKATLRQPRIAGKSVFNYWIKITTHGALNVLRRGKQDKQEHYEDDAGK